MFWANDRCRPTAVEGDGGDAWRLRVGLRFSFNAGIEREKDGAVGIYAG